MFLPERIEGFVQLQPRVPQPLAPAEPILRVWFPYSSRPVPAAGRTSPSLSIGSPEPSLLEFFFAESQVVAKLVVERQADLVNELLTGLAKTL